MCSLTPNRHTAKKRKKQPLSLQNSRHKPLKGFGVKVRGVLSNWQRWKTSPHENLPSPPPCVFVQTGLWHVVLHAWHSLSLLHWCFCKRNKINTHLQTWFLYYRNVNEQDVHSKENHCFYGESFFSGWGWHKADICLLKYLKCLETFRKTPKFFSWMKKLFLPTKSF